MRIYIYLQRFAKFLVETDRALDLTVLLIFHAADNKDNIGKRHKKLPLFY